MLIKVVDDVHGGLLQPTNSSTADRGDDSLYRYSTGVLISKKKLHVCAEFTCAWRLIENK